MVKFTVNVTEIQKGFFEIEAESAEAAEGMAEEVYNDGGVKWTYSSISEVEAKEVMARVKNS